MQTENEFKYLKFTSLEKTVFWDFYTLSNKNSIKSFFPIVNLSEVIIQRKGFITIDDTKIYKRCRVQIQGKGVVLRDEVLGKDIKTKKQQVCKVDDFIVAEIDAKVGGFGIVPKELETAVVSGHYFLFEIDKLKLLPEFLGLIVTQSEFLKQVKSTGSTNYSAIRPSQVLNYKIPLPKIEEQREIINKYLKKTTEAERLKEEADTLEQEIKDFLADKLGLTAEKKTETEKGLHFVNFNNLNRWDLKFLLQHENINKSNYPLIPYEKLFISLKNGISARNYTSHGTRFLKVSDIKLNIIDDSNVKFIQKFKESDLITKNTLLITRKGTVGNSVYINDDKKFTASSEIFIIKLSQEIDGNYFAEVNNMTGFVQKQYIEKNTGTIMPSLSQSKLKEILIPLPPLEIQREISNHVYFLKKSISEMILKAKNKEEDAKQEFERTIFNSNN